MDQSTKAAIVNAAYFKVIIQYLVNKGIMLYFFTFIQGKEKLIYSIGMCEQKNVYQNTRWHLTYFSYLEPILPNTVKP